MRKLIFLFQIIFIFTLSILSPKTHANLSEARLEKITTLDINKVLWQKDLPNAVKGISVAYDSQNDILYTAAITSPYIMISKPSQEHPHDFIKLNTSKDFHTPNILLDPTRNRLIWINHRNEEIQIFDTKTKKLIHQKPGSSTQERYPVKDEFLIEKSGWLWIANTGKKTVTGYSPNLQQTQTISNLSHPFSLTYDDAKNTLFILDAKSRQTSTLVSYNLKDGKTQTIKTFTASQGSRPPRHVFLTKNGHWITASQNLTAYDQNWQKLWESHIPGGTTRIKQIGDKIAVIVRDAHSKKNSKSLVVFLNEKTGAKLKTIHTRFEAQWGDVDEKQNRLFIGNGGDGSVTEIDTTSLQVTRTIDVANGAEGLVVDHKTGNRYILNRLGGSEIYVWSKNSTSLTRLDGGNWPMALAIDEGKRKLIALSHFDSALYQWNLDTQEQLVSIDLEVPHNTGDTLGDLFYDEKTGLSGVVFPESGYVVVTDTSQQKVIWKKQFDSLKKGAKAGPGKGMVALNPDKKQVYIYASQSSQILVYNYETGQDIKTISLTNQTQPSHRKPGFKKRNQRHKFPPRRFKGKPKVMSLYAQRPFKQRFQNQPFQKPFPHRQNKQNQHKNQKPRRQKNGSSYAMNTLFFDGTRKLLFAGNQVINTETLEVKKEIPDLGKVFYADSKMILGLNVNSTSQKEELVLINPDSLTTIKRFPLHDAQQIKFEPTFDPENHLLYLSDLIGARVDVYQFSFSK